MVKRLNRRLRQVLWASVAWVGRTCGIKCSSEAGVRWLCRSLCTKQGMCNTRVTLDNLVYQYHQYGRVTCLCLLSGVYWYTHLISSHDSKHGAF